MICRHCGTPSLSGPTFCTQCGTRLAGSVEEPTIESAQEGFWWNPFRRVFWRVFAKLYWRRTGFRVFAVLLGLMFVGFLLFAAFSIYNSPGAQKGRINSQLRQLNTERSMLLLNDQGTSEIDQQIAGLNTELEKFQQAEEAQAKADSEEKARWIVEQQRQAAIASWYKFQKHCNDLRNKKIVDLTTNDETELRLCGANTTP